MGDACRFAPQGRWDERGPPGDLALTHSWTGYRPGATEASEIHLTEFYDCEGSKGIDAILITTSKFNCPSCDLEAGELESCTRPTKRGCRSRR